MSLSQASLKAALLQHVKPVTTEAAAVTNWVAAWEQYFNGATVGVTPITPGSYAPALSAMSLALTGALNTATVAALQLGVSAFWAALLPTSWVTTPVVLTAPPVPPTTIALELPNALIDAFEDNRGGGSADEAMNRIAGALHAYGGIGATILGSVPPAGAVAIPIL